MDSELALVPNGSSLVRHGLKARELEPLTFLATTRILADLIYL